MLQCQKCGLCVLHIGAHLSDDADETVLMDVAIVIDACERQDETFTKHLPDEELVAAITQKFKRRQADLVQRAILHCTSFGKWFGKQTITPDLKKTLEKSFDAMQSARNKSSLADFNYHMVSLFHVGEIMECVSHILDVYEREADAERMYCLVAAGVIPALYGFMSEGWIIRQSKVECIKTRASSLAERLHRLVPAGTEIRRNESDSDFY